MGNIIKLTEGDLIKLIKRVLSEEEMEEASSPAQQAAIAINMKKNGKKPKVVAVSEEQFERLFEYNTEDPILMYEDEFGSVEEVDLNSLNEAEYQGRKVQLGKIMQGDVKKSKVYVKNDKGKVVKVNFGFGGKSAHGKRMTIKKNNPERRRNFRARMNCDNPGPRWKPRYWACRSW
jgi:translation initiation factor IF-2